MNRIAPIQTAKMKKVGDIRHKAFALLMSVLLVLTCLPIIPGSVKEAHAETPNISITGYAKVNIKMSTQAHIQYSRMGRFNLFTVGMVPSCDVYNDSAYRTLVTNSMSLSMHSGIYSDPACTVQISSATGTSTVPITNATLAPPNVVSGMNVPHTYSPTLPRSSLPVAPITFTSTLGPYTASAQGKVNVGGTIYNVGAPVSCSEGGRVSTFTWDGTLLPANNLPGDKHYIIPQAETNPKNVASSTTSTDTITVIVPVTYIDNNSYNPLVTASPDLYKNLGDAVSDWAESITATWGHTTTNTIPSMGAITDDSLSGGTDSDLSTAGTVFDRVGVKKHDYTIEDDHALHPATPDGTFASTSRNIVIQALTAPQFDIVYSAGALDKDGVTSIAGNAYNGEWTNQPLDMDASHTDPGTYNTVIRRYDSPPLTTYGIGIRSSGNSASLGGYLSDSDTNAGNDFAAILDEADPMSPGDYIDLSPESAKKLVKIDTVDPIPNFTYTSATNTFTDNSTDALSGVDTTRTKIAVVADGVIPLNSDYVSYPLVVSSPGIYDVWVWAWDEAGNNVKTLVGDDFVILTSQTPTITGELASGPNLGDAIGSGVWTNQDVKVIATPPALVGSYYTIINQDVTDIRQAKGTNPTDPADITYSAETASTVVYSKLVDTTPAEGNLSNPSATYEIKIDKTLPLGDVSFNAGVPDYGFTDTSTDTASLIANSGIDSAKTEVCVVASGSAQPTRSEYVSIAGEEIPASGWYDVWVIATDIAGNESVPVKALEHIARSGLDEIKAKDFAWDIASGASALNNAMAVLVSRVEGSPFGSATPFLSTDFIVDPADLASIHAAITAGQKGTTWPLKFSTPISGTQASTTINVTIFDSGSVVPLPPGPLTQELIYANDFNWGISTGSLSQASAKITSQVIGYDTAGDPLPSLLIGTNTSELAAINAAIASGQKDTTWPLTFNTPDGTSVTINVNLYDRGPVNPPLAGDEHIVGNDFAWGISTGAISASEIFFLGRVAATSATGVPFANSTLSIDASELSDINAAIAAGKKGTVWPLTLTTDGSSGNAASATLYVTLYDAGPPSVLAGAEHVVGNNFNWGISTGALTESAAFALSQTQAQSGSGTTLDLSHVSADTTELAAINAAIAAGQKGTTWPLTYTTDGSSGSAAFAVVLVTLFDNGPSIVPSAGSEQIVGNNFNWGISTGDLDKSSAQILSLLEATSALGTALDMSQVSIDASELGAVNAAIAAKQKDTTWPLTFTTDGASGTPASTTVYVTLFDNGPSIAPSVGSEHIVGNNFKWGITSGAISDAHVLHLGKIQATSADGLAMALSTVSVDPSDLADLNAAISSGEAGTTWPLTLTTDGSSGTASSVTIYVTLYDAGHSTPTPGDPHIVSNHFTRAISAGALDDPTAKAHSLVDALSADGTVGNLADIALDTTELAAINAAIAAADTSQPAFPLTFTYTCPQTSLQVSAVSLVTLVGDADLAITKTVDNANPLPGDTVTYTITAQNKGDAAARGLWIKDNLPEGTIFVSCDAQGVYGSTVDDEEYVHWYVPSLGVGETVTFTVTVRVKECSPGTEIKNIALYEEGMSGLPHNLDNDPQGGKTDPAVSTVGDPGASPSGKADPAKKLLRTGDGVLVFTNLTILAALGLLLALFAYKRRKNESR